MREERHYFVYMIASISRVLYIGMTSNLRKRVWEHKNGIFEGFSKQYRCYRLVWYESYDDVANAIDREKATEAMEQGQERMVDFSQKSNVGRFGGGVVCATPT